MKSILKQIKNERRSNTFLWAELCLVFIILWFIVDIVYVTARVYFAPMGFDIEHTYVMRLNRLTPKSVLYQPDLTIDDDLEALKEIVDRLAHRPDVEAVSISQNCIPYNDGSNGIGFTIDSTWVSSLHRWITPGFFQVFRYQNIDGSGSKSLDDALEEQTIVTSVDVADQSPNFPVHGEALRGQMVQVGSNKEAPKYRIAALSEPVRYDHFTPAGHWESRYIATYLLDGSIKAMGAIRYLEVSLRVREGYTNGFSDRLMEYADQLYQVGNLYILDLQSLNDIRRAHEMDNMNELRTQCCILFFLLLNIFLGVIGTFWFRTQHRRSEVALHMALGASRLAVFKRLIFEGLLLLTFATLPTMIVTFNLGYAEIVETSRMPFDIVRFLVGTLIAYALMALMIVVGIWYPAWQAMNIQPAEALHEE